jgi:tetratricopeptide (TPR) repeat protein
MAIALLCLLLLAQGGAAAPDAKAAGQAGAAVRGPPSPGAGAKARRAPKTFLAVPFAIREETPDWTGIAMSEVIADAIAQQDRDNFVAFKQLDVLLRRRGIGIADAAVPATAVGLARALGATDVITGEVARLGGSVAIEARRLRAKTGEVLRTARVDGPFAEMPALAQRVAVQLLLAPPGSAPMAADAAALENLIRCELSVIAQPLGPRALPALSNETLHAAEESCGAALESDRSLGLAHAALSVALGARGNLAEAREQASAAQSSGRFVPLAVAAESWIARRRGDPAEATAVLRRAIAKHPGFLHAHGLLGEDRSEAGDAAGSLQAFDGYLARVPFYPWAMARRGRELSRLGRKKEAIATTRAALARDPGDPELSIELATRCMEAGKDDLAEEQLKLALIARPIRPLASLRLGSLYLRKGKLAEARAALERTVLEATREDQARMRAGAHAELARLAAISGRRGEMIDELRRARAGGRGRHLCGEPAFAQWKGLPEMEELCAKGAGSAAASQDESDDGVAIELE